VALHEAFEKALELSSCAAAWRRAEDAQAVGAEVVDHAGGQRRLGADHRQGDLLLQRPVAQLAQVA
jgi:hypothetical protein